MPWVNSEIHYTTPMGTWARYHPTKLGGGQWTYRALWLDATFFENPECTHEGHLFIDFTMATPASPKSIAVECQGHFG